MNKKLIVLLLVGGIGLFGLVRYYSDEADKILRDQQVEKGEKTLTKDEKEVEEIFKKSIELSNEKNIDAYVQLILPKSRESTKKELGKFFEEYDVEITLQRFKILNAQKDHILAEVVQKSVSKGKKEYKNHIATENVAFIKEGGNWLIEWASVIDTKPVDQSK